MIKRNDRADVPVETENDKARLSIKKGFLTFGCVIAVAACAVSFKNYLDNKSIRDDEAKKIKDAIDSLEVPYWRATSSGFGADTVADMSLAGMDVASLQNEYLNGTRDMLEIQTDLREFFDDSSGELTWFYTGSDAEGLVWQFETGSGIESAAENGMWCLYNQEHHLCAYAMAGYDIKSGRFGKIECHVTTEGYAVSAASDMPDGVGEDMGYDENYDFMADPEGRLSNNFEEVGADVEKETE